MFGRLGMGELLVILVVVILIFGVNRKQHLGKGLGKGIKNVKSTLKAGGKDPNTREAEMKNEKH